MNSVADWVKYLELEAHPEGGYFTETYRSSGVIPQHALPESFSGERNYGTAIYFLLGPEDHSSFHRLKADEVWHFYAGGRMEISVIYPGGALRNLALGPNASDGESFQLVVPAGTWFGARPVSGQYTLAGCTMAPGFDFADFEMADRDQLTEEFPQHAEIITRLT